jgi:hypothetical protein
MVQLGFRPKLRSMPTWWWRANWTATPTVAAASVRGEHLGSPGPNRRPQHESRGTLLCTPADRH